MVLPFLLNTGKSDGLVCLARTPPREGSCRGIISASNLAHTDNQSLEDSREEAGVHCPWCAEMTYSSGGAGDADIAGWHGGREFANVSTAMTAEGGCVGYSHCTVVNESSSKRTCKSCGASSFYCDLQPASALWTIRSVASWNNVRSAGCRTHGAVSIGGRTGQVKEERQGAVFNRPFFQSCLRASVERENLRRRHRREERGIALGIEENHGKVQPNAAEERKGGHLQSPVAPLPLSKRKLNASLTLEKTHARERVVLAIKQLLVHIGPGDDQSRAEQVTEEYLVVTPGVTEYIDELGKKSGEEGGLLRTGEMSECLVHQRATKIQRFWRRWHRASAGYAGDISAHMRRKKVTECAAIKLQSTFRGYHVRRVLQVRERVKTLTSMGW